MQNNDTILVTSPLLPDLQEFNRYLQQIWDSKWITNNGSFHQQLEKALAEYLGVEYLSLFTNGTLPLITALQALGLTKGEVITTPYSFVATSHSIWWNQLTPVFVDIEEDTCGMDPAKIEAAITENTVAIMPVHCYGKPCKTEQIDAIAKKHGLKVIYDAAHAFGVKVNGKSILNAGDISTLSFHATKVYNTIEGGALICHSAEMKHQIDNLKNFGFRGEVTVEAPGINGKMDEVRAAYGLLNLKQVDAAIEARQQVAIKYREALKDVEGVDERDRADERERRRQPAVLRRVEDEQAHGADGKLQQKPEFQSVQVMFHQNSYFFCVPDKKQTLQTQRMPRAFEAFEMSQMARQRPWPRRRWTGRRLRRRRRWS